MAPSTRNPSSVTAEQDRAESAVVRRVGEQDSEAFEALYKLYYSRVSRFAYRTTHRPDLVEEIVNDALFVVWCKAATFTGGSRVSTWIFGIAYRKALKALARQQEDAGRDIPIEDVEEILPGPGQRELKQVEIDDWLDKALAGLSPEQRAVLELTYREGLDYREIAATLNCPENTVKTRMFHARRKLQPWLPDLIDTSCRLTRR